MNEWLISVGVDRALTTKLDDAREALQYKLNEIIAVYRSMYASQGQSDMMILPPNLKLLPVMVLGLLKNVLSWFAINLFRRFCGQPILSRAI